MTDNTLPIAQDGQRTFWGAGNPTRMLTRLPISSRGTDKPKLWMGNLSAT
ncbi:MAG: hypothetical protein ACPGLY_27125 [Rubripirellula sp.]